MDFPCHQKTLQLLQFLQMWIEVTDGFVTARSEALAVILSEAKDLSVKNQILRNRGSE